MAPESKPLASQLIEFEKKAQAGIDFVQTQAIYNLDNFRRFMEYARQFPVKVLAGIIPLASAGMARYMNANIPGILVPDELIIEMDSAPKGKAQQKGIEIASRMIRTLRSEGICDGVHIMTIGREETIPDILTASR